VKRNKDGREEMKDFKERKKSQGKEETQQIRT